MWLSGIFLSLVLSITCAAKVEVTYEIPQGKIKGLKTESNYNGITYFSFKGIPYSQPRIKEEKFEPPLPPDTWHGVLDATKHGEVCYQNDMILRHITGSDDCLFLNVYTPDMSTDKCNAVMVWIHGGAFQFGSGDDNIYGPDFLIELGVVVVTLNYRLGPIGFINTGDANAPGNIGLKDQAFALKWVRNNIEYFGGCSDKITIFGESAGSASVHYHLLSPMSRGLFDQSIQQSGSATDEWAYTYHARENAFALGKLIGIDTTDSKVLMDALKKMDTEDILIASDKMAEGFTLEAILTWVPSVEASIYGSNPFLPDHPMTLITEGKIYDVPMIAGVNLDECALFLHDVINHVEQNWEYIYTEMHTLLPNNLNVTDIDEAKGMVKEIYEFYFGNKNITRDMSDKVLELLNDAAFFIQYHITTLVAGEHIKSPIYKYLLSHRSPDGIIKSFKNLGNVSSHTDDLQYLWHWTMFENIPEPNSSGEHLVKLFTRMWTNFAKSGDPTSVRDDVVKVKWEPMGKENNILNIDLQCKMQKGFFKDRMNFWVKMYNKVLGKFGELLTVAGSGTMTSSSSIVIICGIIYCFLIQRIL